MTAVGKNHWAMSAQGNVTSHSCLSVYQRLVMLAVIKYRNDDEVTHDNISLTHNMYYI